MAQQNILMLDTDHPNVVIKPVDDGKEVKCYHIEAWLTFEEFHKAKAVIDRDLRVKVVEQSDGSGYYRNDGTEITDAEIAEKMKFLNDTGEYDGFSYNELRKIAIEMLHISIE